MRRSWCGSDIHGLDLSRSAVEVAVAVELVNGRSNLTLAGGCVRSRQTPNDKDSGGPALIPFEIGCLLLAGEPG